MSGIRREKRKSNIGSLFKLSFMISFFLLFIALWVIEGRNFTSALDYVFSKKNIIIYDTFTVSFDESIVSDYKDSVIQNLEKLEFNGKRRFEIEEGNADIELSRTEEEDSKEIFSKRLIPVGHIYSLLEGIKEEDLANYNIFVLDSVYSSYLEEEYGIDITVSNSYEELVTVLESDDMNVGLIDLDDIDFRVKVLEMDEKYYFDDIDACIPIRLFAILDKKVDDFILSVLVKNIDSQDTVFDMEELVKINMSGVVAISRALASKIDKSGDYGYPAREIGGFLANADLTHISNEVSFVPGCSTYSGMRFCSRPEYIKVLEDSGVDIVELTGNHNNDYGSIYSAETIEKYKSLGMRYFGGGLDEVDASKILYEEVKGTKIAFVGYNYYDTIYRSLALAGEERSGANYYSDEKVKSDIEEAKKNASIVIVTFQFQECYSYPDSDVIYPICYKPLSNPDQRDVFRKAIDYGANIVVGTQAHQPQTYELYGNGVIYYGLGNLYFDQNMWIGTRQGLILTHYFYKGEHIQTKLVPIFLGSDLIPRLATQEQSDLLLELLKDARE